MQQIVDPQDVDSLHHAEDEENNDRRRHGEFKGGSAVAISEKFLHLTEPEWSGWMTR